MEIRVTWTDNESVRRLQHHSLTESLTATIRYTRFDNHVLRYKWTGR